MSTRADELLQMVQRGERVASVREALGLTGDQFAEKIVKAGAVIGALLDFDKHKLSRVEGGTRKLTVEEAVIIVSLDPQRRGIEWLVFGSAAPRRQREPRERRVG